MKPSRTFTIAMWSISSIFILGLAMLAAIVVVAWLAPEQLETLAGFFTTYGTFALSIAGVGAGGAGAMSHRDASSGGLTSSAGASVLAAQRHKAGLGDP
jgi:hypothetical protein